MIYELATSGYSLGISRTGTVCVRPRLTVKRIQSVVADYYGIAVDDFPAARRDRLTAHPRQVAMYLARQLTPKSLPDIGRIFNRDHTTVLYALSAVKRRMRDDPELFEDVRAIRERLAA